MHKGMLMQMVAWIGHQSTARGAAIFPLARISAKGAQARTASKPATHHQRRAPSNTQQHGRQVCRGPARPTELLSSRQAPSKRPLRCSILQRCAPSLQTRQQER